MTSNSRFGPLPAELWLEVFEWCFALPDSRDLLSDSYIPFQSLYDDREYIRLKAAVNLVCRQWRALTLAILYQDVHILPSTAPALRYAVGQKASEGPHGYGQWVRRVVLPYTSTITHTAAPLQAVHILKYCPGVEALSRPRHAVPGPIGFEYEAETLHFPALRRLEWWGNEEAERSGGLNSLGTVLAHAPGLRYLFIGGIMGTSSAGSQPSDLALLHLETLRLNVINGLLLNRLCSRWSLPALRHVVLDSPLVGSDVGVLWGSLGPKLEVVELGAHARFIMTDMITPCLHGCPDLRELNYHVFFTIPPHPDLRHNSLEVVRLHGAADQLLGEGTVVWKHLQWHLEDMLTVERFPSLKRVYLVGEEWRILGRKPGFSIMLGELAAKGHRLDLLVY